MLATWACSKYIARIIYHSNDKDHNNNNSDDDTNDICKKNILDISIIYI